MSYAIKQMTFHRKYPVKYADFRIMRIYIVADR